MFVEKVVDAYNQEVIQSYLNSQFMERIPGYTLDSPQ